MVKTHKLIVGALILCQAHGLTPCKPPASPGCVEPSLSPDSNGAEFSAYQREFNKIYATSEEAEFRRGVWLANTMSIIQSNKENHSYSLGWNQYTDWTTEEMQLHREGDIGSESTLEALGLSHSGEFHAEDNLTMFRHELDWTKHAFEVVTSVKHQQCGDCWAFSASGCIEGAAAIAKGGSQRSLSAQQFVDCSDAGSCGGGYKDKAMDWAKKHGICSWNSYKETGKDGKCKESSCDVDVKQGYVHGAYYVKPDSESSLISALNRQPIAVSVATGDKFHKYRSGIFHASFPDHTSHAILMVGYGTHNGQKYWKVKNSWATTWGIDGYCLLKRDGDGKGQNLVMTKPWGVHVQSSPSPRRRRSDPRRRRSDPRRRRSHASTPAIVV